MHGYSLIIWKLWHATKHELLTQFTSHRQALRRSTDDCWQCFWVFQDVNPHGGYLAANSIPWWWRHLPWYISRWPFQCHHEGQNGRGLAVDRRNAITILVIRLYLDMWYSETFLGANSESVWYWLWMDSVLNGTGFSWFWFGIGSELTCDEFGFKQKRQSEWFAIDRLLIFLPFGVDLGWIHESFSSLSLLRFVVVSLLFRSVGCFMGSTFSDSSLNCNYSHFWDL